MNVFPHAIEIETSLGTITGKLKGVIPRVIPIGWRNEWTSIP